MENSKRIEAARKLHAMGYSCSQSVLMACGDLIGIDESRAARIGAGLGAGVASGEICGVPNAMAIAIGMANGLSDADSKKSAMPKVRKLCMAFSAPYGGCITCRDLKGKCGRSCTELIEEGVALLEKELVAE